jgi:hypothetical protein
VQLELSTSASVSKLVLGGIGVESSGISMSVFADRLSTFMNPGCDLVCESMDLNRHADLQDISFEDRCSVRCFGVRRWECL